MKVDKNWALNQLLEKDTEFETFFSHGSLSVEVYKPDKVDKQKPHERDEVYIIISGSGEFLSGEERMDFQPGDFLFVPAFREHKFVNFTEDFSTWVLFYGPKGGEGK